MSMHRRLEALEARMSKSDGITCAACASRGRSGYCFHRMPAPLRDLVPRFETAWHQHVQEVKEREHAES
jgi:hypothetical protein